MFENVESSKRENARGEKWGMTLFIALPRRKEAFQKREAAVQLQQCNISEEDFDLANKQTMPREKQHFRII